MVVSRRGMKLARGLGWVSRAGVVQHQSARGERDEREGRYRCEREGREENRETQEGAIERGRAVVRVKERVGCIGRENEREGRWNVTEKEREV